MVKIQGPESEYDRLDQIVREVAEAGSVTVDVTGWTRKTYDIYDDRGRHESRRLLVRVESFATTNGEVQVFEQDGMAIAEAIAGKLESEFELGDAVIVRR